MRKLILFFSFFILTSTVFANTANPKIGGWQITSNIAHGIGARLTASKDVIVNGATKTMTSVASVSPNPTNVAKFLAKAGGLSIAIDAMDYLLDGVDYVMDPANNTVTYKDKESSNPVATSPYIYTSKDNFKGNAYTHESACQKIYDEYKRSGYTLLSSTPSFQNNSPKHPTCLVVELTISTNKTSNVHILLSTVVNPNYDPAVEDKPKTVPLSEVGSRVIDKAEEDIKAGNISPAVTLARAVAQDLVAEHAGTDEKVRPVPPIAQELAKNAVIPEEGTATGEIAPTEANPEGSSFAMEFPSFCGWASTICTFIDWVKTDPDLEEIELPEEELEEEEIDENKIRISSGQCKNIDVDLGNVVFGDSFKMTYQMSQVCSAISPLKYVLKFITFLACILILWRY